MCLDVWSFDDCFLLFMHFADTFIKASYSAYKACILCVFDTVFIWHVMYDLVFIYAALPCDTIKWYGIYTVYDTI